MSTVPYIFATQSGNIPLSELDANFANVKANVDYANSATTAGTVTTAAQPNITSVGTLTSLSVSGNISGTGATFTGNLATGNISGASATFTGNLATGNISGTGATFTSNISSTGATFTGNISGTGATFTSNISGTGAAFTGNISGASATFTGNLATGNISGAGATFTGNLATGNISGIGATFTSSLTASTITTVELVGDVKGSIYADDSTIMVDAVDNYITSTTSSFTSTSTANLIASTAITNQGLEIVRPNYVTVNSNTTIALSNTRTYNLIAGGNVGYTLTIDMPVNPVNGQVTRFAINGNALTLAVGNGNVSYDFSGLNATGNTYGYIYGELSGYWTRCE